MTLEDALQEPGLPTIIARGRRLIRRIDVRPSIWTAWSVNAGLKMRLMSRRRHISCTIRPHIAKEQDSKQWA
jgi:hypothetical protein